MGIRMLHHRTTPARARTDGPARVPLLPVPVFAPGASTGRTPATLTTVLRRTATDLRRGLARRASATAAAQEPPAWRLWADLARGYLALALTLLPRPRPAHTFTVFVATADTLGARPRGPAPY
ncbi:hypothetical protein KBZ94_17150 [Streptomyces sp. RM72]|uniref:hypothetical protein n=1 Tax=Streptomyces sp. RM72 TaxID=1115510 RepID=UPI001B3594D6|nr:hypothetical protein [Streptomyces sp. RM72]MBQ0886641.1 hypothetical protein [Streptomyces sp. RM72]